MQLNLQFEQIHQSPTIEMADRVSALKSSGRKIIGLQTGDPDLATPQAILDVAVEAMRAGFTHYAPSRGFPELRNAVVFKLERDNGVKFDPEAEILVTHGGIHAYYSVLQSILNPGDEVLLPDPTWATHANMVTMLRGRVVRVPAPAGNGFIPTLEAWERGLTPQTKAIVINYPSNPTGVFPSRDYLANLQELAATHHLWVVSDEVYENLFYTSDHPTCAATFPEAKAHTILVGSLSKTYAMTGWRVGYLAAPAHVIENALKAGQHSITCVAPFVQKAAAFALSDPCMQIAAAEMRAIYARRRELVLEIAREHGDSPIRITPPQGAFYFFLDFRALNIPSLEICERLLSEANVGLVPGMAFGHQGEGFMRMTIAASDSEVEGGLRAIFRWVNHQRAHKD
jgi:aspartate/methionine/tyrosine aminotransferase